MCVACLEQPVCEGEQLRGRRAECPDLDRAEAELIIRELREAYALGKIPAGSWEANVAYFLLAVFADNLLNWFKRVCLAPERERLSLRNRLLLVPAELVRPQGAPVWNMPRSYPHQEQLLNALKRLARFTLT
jgi:hypothetical protein